MKTIMISVCTLLLFASCSPYQAKEPDKIGQQIASGYMTAHPGRDTVNFKWQLDPSTRKHMAAIGQILAEKKSRDQIGKAGLQLKEKIDLLISECKMKGADHDALHYWLEGFIRDLNRLQKNQVDLLTGWTELQEHMKRFDRDFR